MSRQKLFLSLKQLIFCTMILALSPIQNSPEKTLLKKIVTGLYSKDDVNKCLKILQDKQSTIEKFVTLLVNDTVGWLKQFLALNISSDSLVEKVSSSAQMMLIKLEPHLTLLDRWGKITGFQHLTEQIQTNILVLKEATAQPVNFIIKIFQQKLHSKELYENAKKRFIRIFHEQLNQLKNSLLITDSELKELQRLALVLIMSVSPKKAFLNQQKCKQLENLKKIYDFLQKCEASEPSQAEHKPAKPA